jgi:UrcA family protein
MRSNSAHAAIIAIAVAALCGAATPAASRVAPASSSVRDDPRELQAREGITPVYLRIVEAARTACAALPIVDRWRERDRAGCRADTLDAAIRAAAAAPLTARHRTCRRRPKTAGCPAAPMP